MRMFSFLAIGLQGCVSFGPDADMVGQLNREIIALQNRNQMLEKTAETCDDPTASPPRIFTDLNQVFYEGDVKISRDGSVVHRTKTPAVARSPCHPKRS